MNRPDPSDLSIIVSHYDPIITYTMAGPILDALTTVTYDNGILSAGDEPPRLSMPLRRAAAARLTKDRFQVFATSDALDVAEMMRTERITHAILHYGLYRADSGPILSGRDIVMDALGSGLSQSGPLRYLFIGGDPERDASHWADLHGFDKSGCIGFVHAIAPQLAEDLVRWQTVGTPMSESSSNELYRPG